MASAGTLSVSILARTKKFRSSMRQVRKEITNLRRKVFSVGVGLTAVAFGLSALNSSSSQLVFVNRPQY